MSRSLILTASYCHFFHFQGLSVIDTDVDQMNVKANDSHLKDRLQPCNPSVVIPLPYQSLSNNEEALSSQHEARNELILKRQRLYADSWHGQVSKMSND